MNKEIIVSLLVIDIFIIYYKRISELDYCSDNMMG